MPRIHWNETVEVFCYTSPLLSVLPSDLWWEPHDYLIFKDQGRLIARQSRRSFGVLLERSLGNLNEERSVNDGSADEDDEDATADIPESPLLNQWSSFGHSRRGLERWCNVLHGKERKTRQRYCIERVLQAQENIVMMAAPNNNALNTNRIQLLQQQEQQHGRLAQISRFHSSSARRFARELGRADARAAEMEHMATRNNDNHTNNQEMRTLENKAMTCLILGQLRYRKDIVCSSAA